MHSPTTTSNPRSRSDAIAASSRGHMPISTPLDGEVTPIRSPGTSGRGKRVTGQAVSPSSTSRTASSPARTSANDVDSGDSPIRRPCGSR